jgi:uncharacterized protein (DUF1684 family)
MEMMEVSEWLNMIQEEREQKDMFFLNNYNSPISDEKRRFFEGLDYYPPDPDFRFELELLEHKEKTNLKINDTKGYVREFLRWGEFRFKIKDEECILQAYNNGNLEEDRLFVPFRAKTSGNETYGAGRYIDLNYEEHCTQEGKWILDFNKAYNPWCAYSEHYACPYIDPENWLQVPIYAGEKNYSIEKR